MGGLIRNCGRVSIRLKRRLISFGLFREGILVLTFKDRLDQSCACLNRCLILTFIHRSTT